MDSVYFVKKLTDINSHYANKYDKLITDGSIIFSKPDLITDGKFDFKKFMSLESKEQIFILGALGNGLNYPETIKLILNYYKMKESNNLLLLKSDKFRKKEEKISELNELFINTYNEILSKCKEVTSQINSTMILISILKGEIDESILKSNGSEIIGMIEEKNLTEEEKTKLAYRIFEKLSDYLEEQINKKTTEEDKQLEDNSKKLYEKSVEINSDKKKVPGIKTKTIERIKNIVNNDSAINNILNESELLFDDIYQIIYDYLIEESAILKNISDEIIKEYIIKYVNREQDLLARKKYSNLISESSIITDFLSNYMSNLSSDSFAEHCYKRFVQLNEEEMIEELKRLFISKMENYKELIDSNIQTAALLLGDNASRTGLDSETIDTFRNSLASESINLERLVDLKEKVNEAFDYISNNTGLLTKELSDTEFDEYSALVSKINTFTKLFKESIRKEDIVENIKDGYFALEISELLSIAKELNNEIMPSITNDIDITPEEIHNPFKNILFLDNALLDVFNDIEEANGYRNKVSDLLSTLDEKGVTEGGIKVTKYHSKDKYAPHKKLKENDVFEAKKGDVRMFVTETKNQDGGDKYVVVYVDKKKANGSSQKKNAEEAANFLTGKEQQLKDLVEKTKNPEELERELNNQKFLAYKLGNTLGIRKRR